MVNCKTCKYWRKSGRFKDDWFVCKIMDTSKDFNLRDNCGSYEPRGLKFWARVGIVAILDKVAGVILRFWKI